MVRLFCDNDCGVELFSDPTYPELFTGVWVSELPVDVETANAGESAILCEDCADEMERRANDE